MGPNEEDQLSKAILQLSYVSLVLSEKPLSGSLFPDCTRTSSTYIWTLSQNYSHISFLIFPQKKIFPLVLFFSPPFFFFHRQLVKFVCLAKIDGRLGEARSGSICTTTTYINMLLLPLSFSGDPKIGAYENNPAIGSMILLGCVLTYR